jgi:hypothetical protein|uniref:Uncharacterized protein n=1 Tax=Oryza nivara TaxID=4536 RepID=A0A0E0GE27_ORYNI
MEWDPYAGQAVGIILLCVWSLCGLRGFAMVLIGKQTNAVHLPLVQFYAIEANATYFLTVIMLQIVIVYELATIFLR